MEEKVKDIEKETNKKKNKKITMIMVIIIIIWTMLLVANSYASNNGYGNIFFAIKSLISEDKIVEKDEIFFDKDITISYSNIEIVDGIKIQINKLQIEEEKSTLYVSVNTENILEDTNKNLPFKYKVYNENGKLICDKSGKNNEQLNVIYTEELELGKLDMEVKYLKLEIYSANDELLATLNIDIENKAITIEGQNEAINKLSEIELKEYIGTYIEKTENVPEALCLEIKNITYTNNVYTVIFTYCYPESKNSLEIEGLSVYEATMRFSYNENKEEKYEIIDLTNIQLLIDGKEEEYNKHNTENVENNNVINSENNLQTEEVNQIIQDISTIRNELTAYLTEVNNTVVSNNISDFNIQFNKTENEIQEYKYVEELMLSRVCAIIVKANEYDSLSYVEVCNYNIEHGNNAEKRYTIMFMYNGHQTQISANSYESNCLLFSRYDESKKNIITYKLHLNQSVLELLSNLYEDNSYDK